MSVRAANRSRWTPIILASVTLVLCLNEVPASAEAIRPNIIFIMADDLGHADLGCYGQQRIRTPNIDALAAGGVRFTNCYGGSPVCAPSRSVLMTGQHTGHTTVRGNGCIRGGIVQDGVRRANLTDEDVTVAHVLRDAGYRTGLVGKWHLGGYHPTAEPMDRGFDEFYGWMDRTPETELPHLYYPAKRYRNRELYDVAANQDGQRGYYHTDMCTDEAIAFVKNHKAGPFFLALCYVNPHSPFLAPSHGDYADEPWGEQEKTYAAMVSYLDACVGRLMQTLKEEGLEKNTIVFFASDHGSRSGAGQTAVVKFFDSNGPLRGYKRDMTEGGIRVPMIVRWPGRVPQNKTDDTLWYFADFLPTAAALAGTDTPQDVDGLNLSPTLLGEDQDVSDRFLYWEFFERGFQQAVRWRNWKGIRLKPGADLTLFDLSNDIGEQHDVAGDNPEIVARIEEYLATARTESANWPVKGIGK